MEPRLYYLLWRGIFLRPQKFSEFACARKDMLNRAVSQEFRLRQPVFNHNGIGRKVHREDLLRVLTDGLGVRGATERGGGADADRVSLRRAEPGLQPA